MSEAYEGKVRAWKAMVAIKANHPSHPLYQTYMELAQWLDNNRHKEGEDE